MSGLLCTKRQSSEASTTSRYLHVLSQRCGPGPDKLAVKKAGNKRALRVFDSMDEAKAYLSDSTRASVLRSKSARVLT